MKLRSLACLPLTSCCAAQFLTGQGLVPVWGLGVGDPCYNVTDILPTFESSKSINYDKTRVRRIKKLAYKHAIQKYFRRSDSRW